jgi:RHS repeat-associated protein
MGNPNSYLNQSRAHNAANEVGVISVNMGIGTNWADPTYDAAGNMTAMPNAYSPASNFSLKYDAWNRLVEVTNAGSLVQQNEFDGLGRRIVRSVYVSGSLDHRIRYYYNEAWQLLEERKEVSGTEDSDPINQYIWHPYYIDALAIRWYDADTDNNLAENVDGEYYSLHDANFNVALITYNNGAIAERYLYDPYGGVGIRTWNWAADSDNKSDFGQSHLFTGRELDLETYLQLNRHRFYASHLGRWVTRDPVRYRGGMNLYGYLDAQVLLFNDPMGLGFWSNYWFYLQGNQETAGGAVRSVGGGVASGAEWLGRATGTNIGAGTGAFVGSLVRSSSSGAAGVVDFPGTGQAFVGDVQHSYAVGQEHGLAIGVGEFVGTNQLVEGTYGYDLETQEKLSGEERISRFAEGSGRAGGTLGSAVGLAKPFGGPAMCKFPCFPAGTLVLMGDGTSKPIEEIEPGDMVLADDPEDPEKPSAFKV